MSPVSRGRKPKKTRARRAAPTLDGVYAEMLGSFEPVITEEDPLQVELFVSDLVGAWWQHLARGEDPDTVVGIGAVEYAKRRGTPAAQALLRAFAVVAASPELRQAADAGATELAEQGVADPPWAASIGRVEVGDCWLFRDVFDDQLSVHCEFGYGETRHILTVLLESAPDLYAKDAWISDQPDDVLADVRQQVDDEEDLAVLERIEPTRARRMIESGVFQTDLHDEVEVADTYREFRALTLARCRALPPAAETGPVEVPEEERVRLVEEFLGSAEAKDLPTGLATRACVRILVDFGADGDNGRPLRVSPAKIEVFVHEWLPGEDLDDDAIETMPAVLTAWTRWAGVRLGLPEAAVDHVVEAAEACGSHLADAYDIDLDLYLEDVDDDDPAAAEVLERRLFAVPATGTSIGNEDYSDLNPANPDDRHVLISGEHPEWHHLLDDPAFEGEVDGVNPRLHITMHEIVVTQLWDNNPPEAWLAAQRLLAAGQDRHDILHALANVVTENLHEALKTRQPTEPAKYVKALNDLGRKKTRKLRW